MRSDDDMTAAIPVVCSPRFSRRAFQRWLLGATGVWLAGARLEAQTSTETVELQPFAAAAQRLQIALAAAGASLTAAEQHALHAAGEGGEGTAGVARIEQVLDPHVLLEAHINPEGRVSVSRGMAPAQLVQHGWRVFLVKVRNESGEMSPFTLSSEQAEPCGRESSLAITGVHDFTNGAVDTVVANSRWLAMESWTKPPMQEKLSGLLLEYRILLLYSRDAGRREASIEAMTGGKEQDLGWRSTLPILFACAPSHAVGLHILDGDGRPATASLLITDPLGRIYPAAAKRQDPDLWFQRHVYRADGESILLPPGQYTVEYGRGPEYVKQTTELVVTTGAKQGITLRLERWVSPRSFGYYSGDTHIHAAGCSHYESPTEGVNPPVMHRQVLGEALDVGDVLTWGPGYYHQKQFFSGHLDHATAMEADPGAAGLLRYDVEVSGFPSSHCGHLVLLRLSDQDYPGARTLDDWPSWNIPILQWAKAQGAIAGYAHSGHGLNVASTELPNYLIPPFDSMGANEFIVDVTHPGLVAFLSGCDTRPFAELNIWYHTLNCGFRTVFLGETDFPCLSDERVGAGRSYVKLGDEPRGESGYAAWIDGVVSRPSYAGDGRSHIFNVALSSGVHTATVGALLLDGKGLVDVTASVCARLEPESTPATEAIRTASPYDKPYWHLERSRIGASRRVPVEMIVNGAAVDRVDIEADGRPHTIHFRLPVVRSSWIALRILPSAHTNPIYVEVQGASLRASRRSARWCREGVDVCWKQKSLRIRPGELAAAQEAYDHARRIYDRIVLESIDD